MTDLERLTKRNEELAQANRCMAKDLVEVRKRLNDAEKMIDELQRELEGFRDYKES